ncbi:blue copper protein 1b-like [Corylus avellana]|uniref:blue copper protein 1b-like n=1 Tax=Corylus avellana TaxID=13451 RepID=UPI00286AB380|nr:blue copper protein 1b-like [Corylus avellana]
MASSQYFFILAIVAILVPSILATEFVVGDDKGWTVDYNYTAWAQGKEFHVNQVLGAVFKYTTGSHIVLEVNETGFQQCAALLGTEALVSGNDVITLAILGRNWYIFGVANHCEINNQKLAITVSPAPSSVSVVFKYKEGVHNVLKVNGTGFQQCVAPLGIEALISGNDVITLATSGRKWYICGVAKHCENGNQKLAITVLPQTVSPAPSPVSAAKECVKPIYYGWMMVVFGILAMAMV